MLSDFAASKSCCIKHTFKVKKWFFFPHASTVCLQWVTLRPSGVSWKAADENTETLKSTDMQAKQFLYCLIKSYLKPAVDKCFTWWTVTVKQCNNKTNRNSAMKLVTITSSPFRCVAKSILPDVSLIRVSSFNIYKALHQRYLSINHKRTNYSQFPVLLHKLQITTLSPSLPLEKYEEQQGTNIYFFVLFNFN